MIDKFLLEILACPRCDDRPPVEQIGSFLVCTKCKWGYPIIEDIPRMLPEDAVAPEEVQKQNG